MNLETSFLNWLETKKLSQRTIKEYMMYLNRLDPETFDQESVHRFLEQCNNNVARAFLKNFKSFLVSHRNELELSGDEISEIRDIELPKITGRPKTRVPHIVTIEDLHEMERELSIERDKIMLLLSFYCGLRVQELLKMRIHDIEWKAWKEDQEGFGEATVHGKGNKEAKILIPVFLMARIREFINKERWKVINENGRIFKVSYNNWRKSLKKAGNKVLNKHIRPHDLRHSYGTFLIKKGLRESEIQKLLRHSSISSTQIYTHLSLDDVKSKIQGLFGTQ